MLGRCPLFGMSFNGRSTVQSCIILYIQYSHVCTFMVGCRVLWKFTALPLESTTLPVSSRIRGVGLLVETTPTGSAAATPPPGVVGGSNRFGLERI